MMPILINGYLFFKQFFIFAVLITLFSCGQNSHVRTVDEKSIVPPIEPGASATPTATGTNTSIPTSTPTSDPNNSSTPTPTSTNTSSGPTSTATATATATATSTNTATATASATPSATATASATPSATATASATPSATPSATATGTATPSATATGTATPSATATSTATPSATATGTATPSATPSATATATATATNTFTSAPPTFTPTSTNTPTATNTPTITPTPSPTPTCGLDVYPGNTVFQKLVITQTSWEGPLMNGGNYDTRAQGPASSLSKNHMRYSYISGNFSNGKTLAISLVSPPIMPGMGTSPLTMGNGFNAPNSGNPIFLDREISAFAWISKQQPPTNCYSSPMYGCSQSYTIYKFAPSQNYGGNYYDWFRSQSQRYGHAGNNGANYVSEGIVASVPEFDPPTYPPSNASVTISRSGNLVTVNLGGQSTTADITGCGMDNGLYLGFSLGVKQSGVAHQFYPWGQHFQFNQNGDPKLQYY